MAKRREQEPWIWLQDGEWSGKADGCGCHLDAGGPRDQRGAAFYICLKHEKADDMAKHLRDMLAVFEETCKCRKCGPCKLAGKVRRLMRDIQRKEAT